MGTVTISLPSDLRDWIDRQTAANGFASPGDCINAILRQSQRMQAEDAAFEKTLVDALEEGALIEMTDAEWQKLREECRQGVQTRQ